MDHLTQTDSTGLDHTNRHTIMKFPDYTQTIFTGLQTTYALLNAAGHIIAHDTLFPDWISEEQSNLVGQAVLDILPEFIGHEADLELVSQGKQPFVRLDHQSPHLNRQDPLPYANGRSRTTR